MDSIELVEARQHRLLEQLRSDRKITTTAAADQFGVSVDTLRRDLRDLHERGLLRRVHGGAVPISPLEPSFTGRSTESSASRATLATAVVDRFRSGMVVGLDAGSTNVEIASQIPETLELTIVTNSPPAALAMANHRSARVILLGGSVDLTWMATTGSDTVDAWRTFRLDLAVLGVCAFDPEGGASTRSQHEVSTKRALIEAAAETVVPLQEEKLGTQAPFHVAESSEIDSIVIDTSVESAVTKQCRSAGIDIIVA